MYIYIYIYIYIYVYVSLCRDPIVRYGGMYAIAMAYCGTADNESIRKLLHVAVSDVSDDVRRAAVTSLGTYTNIIDQ
jgi:HEAT repeat protein